MCILLCLRQTKLCLSIGCKELTKCILYRLFLEGNQLVANRIIIIHKADISQLQEAFLSLKSCKLLITEAAGDLSRTVRTEIKEDHSITVLDSSQWLSVLLNDSRYYELICHILGIGISHCLNSILCLLTLAIYQSSICLLYTIPVGITIHCIVTSMQAGNVANTDLVNLCLKLLYILLTGCRRCVTAIQEAVYIYIFYAILLS